MNTIKQILGEDIPGSTDTDVTADEFTSVDHKLRFNLTVNWERAGFVLVEKRPSSTTKKSWSETPTISYFLDELLGEVLYDTPTLDNDNISYPDETRLRDELHQSDESTIPIEIVADTYTISDIKRGLQQRNHGQGWSVSDIRTE